MHKKKKLELVSMYLSQPVQGARHIALRLEETRDGRMEGTVQLDPNTCSIDLWGEPGACTRIGVLSQQVEAVMMRTLDPHGHRRIHWALHIGEMPDKVSLIEYPSANLWYLTVQPDEGGTQVVPLFEARLFAPVAAEKKKTG
jgi:hypothetical protein